MTIEQQIRACEDQISHLEQIKRTLDLADGSIQEKNESKASPIDKLNLDQIERDLDDYYQQIALLKIRRMMGF